MTLECRCSNCGTLLQTTNADPLHDQIEKYHALLRRWHNIAVNGKYGAGKYALKNHPLVAETFAALPPAKQE